MVPAQAAAAIGARSAGGADNEARGTAVNGLSERGMANTAAAACMMGRVLGEPSAACGGRGTGLDDAGLAHKRAVLGRAPEHRALVREARVVEARAPAAARGARLAEHAAHHARGRRGVRHPPLAQAVHSGPARLVIRTARGARADRGRGLCRHQTRPARGIA
ncbi:hypothetical protein CF642_38310, partial [Burkholderia pseudomallei]